MVTQWSWALYTAADFKLLCRIHAPSRLGWAAGTFVEPRYSASVRVYVRLHVRGWVLPVCRVCTLVCCTSVGGEAGGVCVCACVYVFRGGLLRCFAGASSDSRLALSPSLSEIADHNCLCGKHAQKKKTKTGKSWCGARKGTDTCTRWTDLPPIGVSVMPSSNNGAAQVGAIDGRGANLSHQTLRAMATASPKLARQVLGKTFVGLSSAAGFFVSCRALCSGSSACGMNPVTPTAWPY